jgi:hypothetical protein
MNPWRWVDHRIETVSVADLRAYLTGRGWKVALNPNVHLLRFEAPAREGGPSLFQMLPASEEFADFRQRVVELVTTLSEIEDRHPVAVLEDILDRGEPGNGHRRRGTGGVARK